MRPAIGQQPGSLWVSQPVGAAPGQRPTVTTAPTAPQFGFSPNRMLGRSLNATYDKALPVFQNITEKFFWGFISLDICGLWPGRFITGLLAGRRDKDYNPATDNQNPDLRNQPFPKQIRHWLHRTIGGLNWPNCYEEMKREVIVAPGGILFIPSLGFMVGRKLQGKIIELRYATLDGLGKGFAKHLEKLPTTGVVTFEAYKQAVASHLSGQFADPLLKTTVLDNDNLRAELKAHMPHGQEPTYADFLQHRFQAWTDTLFEPRQTRKFLEKGPMQTLRHPVQAFKRWTEKTPLEEKQTKLMQEIGDQLLAFNRKHRMTQYNMAGRTITDPLLHSDQAWVLHTIDSKAKQTSIEGFLGDLGKWGELPQALWKKAGSSQSGGQLAQMAENLYKRAIARKGLVVFSFMGLSSLWLIGLTRFAQSAKAYQATRNLPEHNGAATPSPVPVQFAARPAVSPFNRGGQA